MKWRIGEGTLAHLCQGKDPSPSMISFVLFCTDYFLAFTCGRESNIYLDSRAVVAEGYELLLLALWEMLLVPHMIKPKLAYLFFFFS